MEVSSSIERAQKGRPPAHNEKKIGKNSEIVPTRTLWLAGIAACLSGIAGSLPFGPLFLLIPSIQITGAILQPHWPRSGKWLLAIGAFVLSLYVSVFFIPPIIGGAKSLPAYHDLGVVGLLLLYIASVGLVTWSDVALIAEARRNRGGSAQNPTLPPKI